MFWPFHVLYVNLLCPFVWHFRLVVCKPDYALGWCKTLASLGGSQMSCESCGYTTLVNRSVPTCGGQTQPPWPQSFHTGGFLGMFSMRCRVGLVWYAGFQLCSSEGGAASGSFCVLGSASPPRGLSCFSHKHRLDADQLSSLFQHLLGLCCCCSGGGGLLHLT